jgi:peptidyl-dipeptidase Dcp
MRLLATTATIMPMATAALAQGAVLSAETIAPLPASNPFAQVRTLPFEAPPFDHIKSPDYEPALVAGTAAQRAEISAIANTRSAPTFDNTISAMERSVRLLERASMGVLRRGRRQHR